MLTISFHAYRTIIRKLASVAPDHPFLTDLQEKERLFDEAASRFGVQASA
jgi:hypothetical protein